MKNMILCLFFSWALTGCAVSFDPLGMTERAQIRADASVAQEHERTQAKMAEAQALVDQEIARQAGSNRRAATWALILPVLVIVAGATVAVCLVLNWKGRIAHEQLRLQYTQRPPVVYIEAAPRSEYQLLRDYARSHGGELTFAGGRPFVALPGGQRLLIDKGAL